MDKKINKAVKDIEFLEDPYEETWGEEDSCLFDTIDEDEEIEYDDWDTPKEMVQSVEQYIKEWKDSRYLIEIDTENKIPVKAFEADAGFDLFTPVDVTVKPGQIKKVDLGFKMRFDERSWASIEEKSGLALKGLAVLGGVIDSGYRGSVAVVVTNHNWENPDGIEIKAGEKIAQLVMHPYSQDYKIKKTRIMEESFSKAERGKGGFNSTGNC